MSAGLQFTDDAQRLNALFCSFRKASNECMNSVGKEGGRLTNSMNSAFDATKHFIPSDNPSQITVYSAMLDAQPGSIFDRRNVPASIWPRVRFPNGDVVFPRRNGLCTYMHGLIERRGSVSFRRYVKQKSMSGNVGVLASPDFELNKFPTSFKDMHGIMGLLHGVTRRGGDSVHGLLGMVILERILTPSERTEEKIMRLDLARSVIFNSTGEPSYNYFIQDEGEIYKVDIQSTGRSMFPDAENVYLYIGPVSPRNAACETSMPVSIGVNLLIQTRNRSIDAAHNDTAYEMALQMVLTPMGDAFVSVEWGRASNASTHARETKLESIDVYPTIKLGENPRPRLCMRTSVFNAFGQAFNRVLRKAPTKLEEWFKDPAINYSSEGGNSYSIVFKGVKEGMDYILNSMPLRDMCMRIESYEPDPTLTEYPLRVTAIRNNNNVIWPILHGVPHAGAFMREQILAMNHIQLLKLVVVGLTLECMRLAGIFGDTALVRPHHNPREFHAIMLSVFADDDLVSFETGDIPDEARFYREGSWGKYERVFDRYTKKIMYMWHQHVGTFPFGISWQKETTLRDIHKTRYGLEILIDALTIRTWNMRVAVGRWMGGDTSDGYYGRRPRWAGADRQVSINISPNPIMFSDAEGKQFVLGKTHSGIVMKQDVDKESNPIGEWVPYDVDNKPALSDSQYQNVIMAHKLPGQDTGRLLSKDLELAVIDAIYRDEALNSQINAEVSGTSVSRQSRQDISMYEVMRMESAGDVQCATMKFYVSVRPLKMSVDLGTYASRYIFGWQAIQSTFLDPEFAFGIDEAEMRSHTPADSAALVGYNHFIPSELRGAEREESSGFGPRLAASVQRQMKYCMRDTGTETDQGRIQSLAGRVSLPSDVLLESYKAREWGTGDDNVLKGRGLQYTPSGNRRNEAMFSGKGLIRLYMEMNKQLVITIAAPALPRLTPVGKVITPQSILMEHTRRSMYGEISNMALRSMRAMGNGFPGRGTVALPEKNIGANLEAMLLTRKRILHDAEVAHDMTVYNFAAGTEYGDSDMNPSRMFKDTRNSSRLEELNRRIVDEFGYIHSSICKQMAYGMISTTRPGGQGHAQIRWAGGGPVGKWTSIVQMQTEEGVLYWRDEEKYGFGVEVHTNGKLVWNLRDHYGFMGFCKDASGHDIAPRDSSYVDIDDIRTIYNKSEWRLVQPDAESITKQATLLLDQVSSKSESIIDRKKSAYWVNYSHRHMYRGAYQAGDKGAFGPPTTPSPLCTFGGYYYMEFPPKSTMGIFASDDNVWFSVYEIEIRDNHVQFKAGVDNMMTLLGTMNMPPSIANINLVKRIGVLQQHADVPEFTYEISGPTGKETRTIDGVIGLNALGSIPSYEKPSGSKFQVSDILNFVFSPANIIHHQFRDGEEWHDDATKLDDLCLYLKQCVYLLLHNTRIGNLYDRVANPLKSSDTAGNEQDDLKEHASDAIRGINSFLLLWIRAEVETSKHIQVTYKKSVIKALNRLLDRLFPNIEINMFASIHLPLFKLSKEKWKIGTDWTLRMHTISFIFNADIIPRVCTINGKTVPSLILFQPDRNIDACIRAWDKQLCSESGMVRIKLPVDGKAAIIPEDYFIYQIALFHLFTGSFFIKRAEGEGGKHVCMKYANVAVVLYQHMYIRLSEKLSGIANGPKQIFYDTYDKNRSLTFQPSPDNKIMAERYFNTPVSKELYAGLGTYPPTGPTNLFARVLITDVSKVVENPNVASSADQGMGS